MAKNPDTQAQQKPAAEGEQNPTTFARSAPDARDEVPAPRAMGAPRSGFQRLGQLSPERSPLDDEQAQAISAPLEPLPRASVRKAEGQIVCRPPPGIPLHTLGAVVIGHFRGHTPDGEAIEIAHGTPVRGLPEEVIDVLRKNPEQRVGPFDPRKKSASVVPQQQA